MIANRGQGLANRGQAGGTGWGVRWSESGQPLLVSGTTAGRARRYNKQPGESRVEGNAMFDIMSAMAARKASIKQHASLFLRVIDATKELDNVTLPISQVGFDWQVLTDGNSTIGQRYDAISKIALVWTREAASGMYDQSVVTSAVQMFCTLARSVENRETIPAEADACSTWVRAMMAQQRRLGDKVDLTPAPAPETPAEPAPEAPAAPKRRGRAKATS